jgi:hypothetical protein
MEYGFCFQKHIEKFYRYITLLGSLQENNLDIIILFGMFLVMESFDSFPI